MVKLLDKYGKEVKLGVPSLVAAPRPPAPAPPTPPRAIPAALSPYRSNMVAAPTQVVPRTPVQAPQSPQVAAPAPIARQPVQVARLQVPTLQNPAIQPATLRLPTREQYEANIDAGGTGFGIDPQVYGYPADRTVQQMTPQAMPVRDNRGVLGEMAAARQQQADIAARNVARAETKQREATRKIEDTRRIANPAERMQAYVDLVKDLRGDDNEISRFAGGFVGQTDLKDREAKVRALDAMMHKDFENLTDEQILDNNVISAAKRQIQSGKIQSFVPASTGNEGLVERIMGTFATIRNASGELAQLPGNVLLGQDQEGFQLSDIFRFAVNLLPGSLLAKATAPLTVMEALSGHRMDQEGQIIRQNFLQTLGHTIDGAIDYAGLNFGATGNIMRNLFGQGAKSVSKDVFRNIFKSALSEGIEEGIQQIAGNLGEQGEISWDLLAGVPQAIGLGMAGGGLLDVSAKMSTSLRSGISNAAGVNYETADARTRESINRVAEQMVQDNAPVIQQVVETIKNSNAQSDVDATSVAQGEVIAAPTSQSPTSPPADAVQYRSGVPVGPDGTTTLDAARLTTTTSLPNPQLANANIGSIGVNTSPMPQRTEAPEAVISDTNAPRPISDTNMGESARVVAGQTSLERNRSDLPSGANITVENLKQFMRGDERFRAGSANQQFVDGDNYVYTLRQPSNNSENVAFNRESQKIAEAITKNGVNKNNIRRMLRQNNGTDIYVQDGTISNGFIAVKADTSGIANGKYTLNNDQDVSDFVSLIRGNTAGEQDAVDTGNFGPQYTQFAGRPEEAIDFLLQKKDGEALRAITHPDLGDIDIVYGKGGDDGYGLAHIVEKHGEAMARAVPNIIRNGTVELQAKDRVLISAQNMTAAVRLDWNGTDKQWVVTAFENTKNPAPNDTNVATAKTSPTGSFTEAVIDTSVTDDSGGVNTEDVASQAVENAVQSQTKTPRQIIAEKVNQQIRAGSGTPAANSKQIAKRALVDDVSAIVDMAKGGDSQTGTKGFFNNQVDRVRNSGMIAKQYMEDNGLTDLFKKDKQAYHEFNQLLIAKQAADLRRNGIQTGRTAAEDAAIITSYGEKYADDLNAFREYTNKVLDSSVEYGLISQETADYLREKYPNYAPMNRIFAEDEVARGNGVSTRQIGNLSKQSVIQRIRGSAREVQNPLESMVDKTNILINQGERNVMAQNILSESGIEGVRILEEGQDPERGHGVISFLDDGNKVRVQVPQIIEDQMKNLNPAVQGFLGRVFSVPARTLRAGATSLNLPFALSNLVKDQMQVMITGNVINSAKGTRRAAVAAFSPFKGGREARAELARQGVVGNEAASTFRDLQTTARDMRRQRNLGTRVIDRLIHPLRTLEDLIGTTELFTRAQQYYGTLAATGSETEAANAARNNSLNFGRAGNVIRQINRYVPFTNAGVQGSRTLIRSFKEHPVRTSLAIGALTTIAAGIVYANVTDEEKHKIWEQIPDYEKEANWIIIHDGAYFDEATGRFHGVTKIPTAQFIYPMNNAISNLTQVDKDGTEKLADLGRDLVQLLTSFQIESGDNALMKTVGNITPTALKVPLELGLNKNLFTGGDIIPNKVRNLPGAEQYRESNSGFAKWLGGVLNISPAQIDHTIQGLGGTATASLVADRSVGEQLERRFATAARTHATETANTNFNRYRQQLLDDPTFQAMSQDDRRLALNRLENHVKDVAYAQQDGTTDELGRPQQALLQGFDVNNYNTPGGGTANAPTEADKKVSKLGSGDYTSILNNYDAMRRADNWDNYMQNTRNAEYLVAKAKYDRDDAAGKLSAADKIRRGKELRVAEIKSAWDWETREAYSLAGNRANMQAYLADHPDQKGYLNAMNNALLRAGLITQQTYNSRRNAINGSSSGGGRRRRSARASASVGLGSESARKAAFTSGMGTSSSARPKALAAGTSPQLSNRQVRTIYGDNASKADNRLTFTPQQIIVASKRLNID